MQPLLIDETGSISDSFDNLNLSPIAAIPTTTTSSMNTFDELNYSMSTTTSSSSSSPPPFPNPPIKYEEKSDEKAWEPLAEFFKASKPSTQNNNFSYNYYNAPPPTFKPHFRSPYHPPPQHQTNPIVEPPQHTTKRKRKYEEEDETDEEDKAPNAKRRRINDGMISYDDFISILDKIKPSVVVKEGGVYKQDIKQDMVVKDGGIHQPGMIVKENGTNVNCKNNNNYYGHQHCPHSPLLYCPLCEQHKQMARSSDHGLINNRLEEHSWSLHKGKSQWKLHEDDDKIFKVNYTINKKGDGFKALKEAYKSYYTQWKKSKSSSSSSSSS
eukprot:508358_1